MVLCLHCGYLDFWLISSKHFYLENLSYTKKQQEQAEAQTKAISSKQSTVKACFNFLHIEMGQPPPKRVNPPPSGQ